MKASTKTTLKTTTKPLTTTTVSSIILKDSTSLTNYFGKNFQNKILNSTTFKNSTILTNEQGLDLVKLIGLNTTNVKLLYQSSRDGFDNEAFHDKCDAVSATLIVIKSKNSNIFGGFTSADWSGRGFYKYDTTAYLFSLVNTYNYPIKINVSEPNYAVYTSPYYSIAFGSYFDLECSDNQCSASYLGYSFKLPNNLANNSDSFLGGSPEFQVIEMEVYWIDRNLIK